MKEFVMKKENIQYRNLGRTGVKVSPLCLGTRCHEVSSRDEIRQAVSTTPLGRITMEQGVE